MEDVLTAVRVTHHGPQVQDLPHGDPREPEKSTPRQGVDFHSPNHIVEFLKSSPTEEELFSVLTELDSPCQRGDDGLGIRTANSNSARILQTLVNTTIPDIWGTISNDPSHEKSNHALQKATHQRLRNLLLRCLCSITGINALVSQLRTYLNNTSDLLQGADRHGILLLVNDLLAVLSAVLRPDDLLSRLYNDTLTLYDSDVKRQVVWRELLSLICGGKLLSTTSEAILLTRDVAQGENISWTSDGTLYAAWLGRNISLMVIKFSPDEEFSKAASLALSRALSLGYNSMMTAMPSKMYSFVLTFTLLGYLVKALYQSLLQSGNFSQRWNYIFDRLRQSDQITLLETIIYDLESSLFTRSINPVEVESDNEKSIIGNAASFFDIILGSKRTLQLQVESWLSSGQGGFIQSTAMRRCLILALSRRSGRLSLCSDLQG